jgi:hypothetical protein
MLVSKISKLSIQLKDNKLSKTILLSPSDPSKATRVTSPRSLVAPEPHEVLQLYIYATSNVVSIVIVVKRGESGTNL